jgi:DNA-binding beta-propeller fold protein YncE
MRKSCSMLFLLLVAAAPLKQIATIPLPDVQGRIDHMAYDAGGHRLFVAALGNGTVEVIDTGKRQRIQSLKGFNEPQGVAWLADSKQLVVASGGDGMVRFFDADLKPLGEIRDLDDADNARYDEKSRLVYVGYGTGALAVIDPAKRQKIADIPLAGHPESFQFGKKDSRIFVNLPSAHHVAIVDREKRALVTTWPIAQAANFPMALDEDRQRVLIATRKPAKLVAIDINTGKEIAATDCVADPDDLFVDRANQRICVIGGGGAISVIDGKSFKKSAEIETADGARTGFWVESLGQLFVAVPARGARSAELRIYGE